MRIRIFERNLRHTILAVTVVILFGLFGSLRAQDATPTDQPVVTDVSPTAVPTDVPTLPPTDVPTLPPTQEPPTVVPTDIPSPTPTDVSVQETPVEVSPTDTPSDVPPTEEVIPSPTLAAAPPVFSITDGTAYEAAAGSPLVIQGSVADSLGLVMIMASGTTGTVELTTVEPVESAAPFNTLFTISYTPAPDFTGQDTLTLIAADQAGMQASITLTIQVAALETAAPTPTLEPTPFVEPMRELIIQYNPADSEETIQAMLTSINATELGRIPQIGAMRILVPESISQPSTTMAVLQSSNMAQLAGVAGAEENATYHLSVTINDPRFAEQWGLSNSTGGIYAPYAWTIARTPGYGVTVAVVDSGVDLQHPDLAYQLVPGWDFYNDDNNPDDDLGHGTHVAGIIAARTNNSVGIAGVAFSAKILPIKACGSLGCPAYYVAEGIIYAVDRGARVINLSLGGPLSTTVQGAVNYALSRGVVVVAAAGNTGCTDIGNPQCTNTVEYPAAFAGVISVAAHDSNGTIWDDSANNGGSAYNSNVLVSAPGVNILSLWPLDRTDPDGTDDGYSTATGTSMSTAYVSGTAAMLISSKVATTPATVRDALICGAEDAGDPNYDTRYGYGRLKADLSLNWKNNSSSCKVSLANDNFQNATNIARVPFAVTQPVSDRSVTEQDTDPDICGVVNTQQTLWYKYRAVTAGYYQFTTLGSSYNTVIGVYRGLEGALTEKGCTTTMQMVVPLDAGQTYYIVVGTNEAAPVNDQVLQFRLNPVLAASNIDYQETTTPLAYVGMWSRVYLVGSSGGYTQQTSDPSALVAFSFRGTHFDYVRTVGPDRGAVQVYINNSYVTTISNQAAVQRGNQVASVSVPGAVFGSWNTVYLKRDSSVPGMVDLDRIRAYDFDNSTNSPLITAKVDDRYVGLRYTSGDWTQIPSTGVYYSTLTQTSVPNAGLLFRFRGNVLNIFRMTGPGFADMQVTIDNIITQTVVNTATGLPVVRPYAIDNLTITDHVVEIRNVGNNAGSIQIDAVQALTAAALAAPTFYDERVLNIAYRGVWTDSYPVVGARGYTTRNLTAGSEASFIFSGNDLCIGYRRPNAPFSVYIDGSLTPIKTVAEDSAGSGFTNWCLEYDLRMLLADTLHYVRLSVGTGTVATTLSLDYVRPQRYNTITPARGQVQETDLSIVYGTPADWHLRGAVANSPGGFKPQGGYLKDAETDNTTITFYINGTGFILYTAVGPTRGCWEVSVDSSPIDPIDLKDDLRYRPLGYGVTGLMPGIHRIQLTADTNCSSITPGGLPDTYGVDFDAIRVFP